MFRLIDKDTPLFSKELIAPWRLASLGVGLALLILGSVFLPSDDWDVPVCLVMGFEELSFVRASPDGFPIGISLRLKSIGD